MDPLKIVEQVTEEIIKEFSLPRNICYGYIKKRVAWSFVAGWEEGNRGLGHQKPIVQLNGEDKILAVYRSCAEASRKIDGDKSEISRTATGKRKTYKGFHWRYVEDPEAVTQILDGWQNVL